MSEFIEKKFRAVNVFRLLLLVLSVLIIAFSVMIGFMGRVEELILLLTMSICGLLILGASYLISFRYFVECVRWLENKGLKNIVYDIGLERPTLPRSQIYCGRKAFFCRKPWVILPYAEIAWGYVREQYGAFGIVAKSVIVYTKDGRSFSLDSNEDEFRWLLENYIVKHSPEVLWGSGQKENYLQLNPLAAQAGKKVKRIWGIVFMCIGVLLLNMMLIDVRAAKVVPASIIIVGFFGCGMALYRKGKKEAGNEEYAVDSERYFSLYDDVMSGINTPMSQMEYTGYTLREVRKDKRKNMFFIVLLSIPLLLILIIVTGAIIEIATIRVEDVSTISYQSMSEGEGYYFDEMVLLDLYYQAGALITGDIEIDHYIVSFVDGDGTRVYTDLQTGEYNQIKEKCEMYVRDDSLEEGEVILSGCFHGYESGSTVNYFFNKAYERYSEEVPGEILNWSFFYEDAETMEEYRSEKISIQCWTLCFAAVFIIPCAIGLILLVRKRKEMNRYIIEHDLGIDTRLK